MKWEMKMKRNSLTIFICGALFYEVAMPILCKTTETIMSYLQVVQNSHIVTSQQMQAECDALANGVEPTREIGFRPTEEIYE